MRLLTGLTTKISPLLNMAFCCGAAAQMRFGRPIGATTPAKESGLPKMESAVIEVTRGACDINLITIERPECFYRRTCRHHVIEFTRGPLLEEELRN
jgi:hypothetical protein